MHNNEGRTLRPSWRDSCSLSFGTSLQMAYPSRSALQGCKKAIWNSPFKYSKYSNYNVPPLSLTSDLSSVHVCFSVCIYTRALYSNLKLKTKVYEVKIHNPLTSDRVQVRVYTNTVSQTHRYTHCDKFTSMGQWSGGQITKYAWASQYRTKKGMEERAKETENLLSRATIRPVLHLSEIQPFTRCAWSARLLLHLWDH